MAARRHAVTELLSRIVVPSRLALIYRAGETLGYNPTFNIWHRLSENTSEILRWLRAGRESSALEAHLVSRFGYTPLLARDSLLDSVKWCILRKLLYLDREPSAPALAPPANPLVTVYWICTQACNLRCTYCYQEATVARPKELSTEEAEGLVDQAVEAGVRTFVFTGGEPFVRRDLLRIARHSKNRGLRTTVISNGDYIKRRNIDEISEIFDVVTISLDHMIPEHHDEHRGKGSWQRALDAIDLLLKANVRVDVNSTLSRAGLQDVRELLRLKQTRKIGQHKIVPQFPMGRGSSHREDELTTSELLQLNDRLREEKPQIAENTGSYIKPEGTYGTKGQCRMHCGAGMSEVSVDPEGWVYPCKLLQYPQFRTENIRNMRLAEIYSNNLNLNAIRGRVVDSLTPCKTCVIKNHCGGGCRGIHFSYTQEYLDAHPLFCAYLRRSFEAQAWDSTGILPPRRKAHFCQEPDQRAEQ
jgi:radical SAM protein with 4Fe4S-binding SPASM domain